MNNTTLLSLQQNTALELSNYHDSVGAIIFIVVVLLWYSFSIVFLWIMQTTTANEIVEDLSRYSRGALTHSFCEKTNNKKILEELADKEKRDKLWDIYFSTSGDINERITRAETLRIRHIQQQLSTINAYDRNDREYSSDINVGSSASDTSSIGIPFRVRRRSSMDEQMLEQWKTTAAALKIQQNQSSLAQKIFIQRFLRRKH